MGLKSHNINLTSTLFKVHWSTKLNQNQLEWKVANTRFRKLLSAHTFTLSYIISLKFKKYLLIQMLSPLEEIMQIYTLHQVLDFT